MESVVRSNRAMQKSLQQALAEAARKLKGDGSEPEMAARTKLGGGTVHRILKGQNVQLGSLHQFARGFGFEAWQLLVPGFDPSAPPVLLTPAMLADQAAQQEELETLRAFVEEVRKLGARNTAAAARGHRGAAADLPLEGQGPTGRQRKRSG
jgi:hypothetical protein